MSLQHLGDSNLDVFRTKTLYKDLGKYSNWKPKIYGFFLDIMIVYSLRNKSYLKTLGRSGG